MKPHFAPIALMLAATPAMLAAEPWEQVDELPGEIAIELDQASVFEALDGTRLVLRGTFRRPSGGWTMETSMAVDCAHDQAKVRGVRLLDGDKVLTERVDALAEFAPVAAGSSEAIYFRALCGKDAANDAALPEASEADAGADEPPADDTGASTGE